ncbi:MAG: saccharopine dehydrogenase NADP-binding domain-containing protein [Nibricoccus sp.]
MIHTLNKILVVGFGAVAECALPLILKHVPIRANNITILDFEDRRSKLAAWSGSGVRFERERITPENMARILENRLGAGDLLIDLAWNIDTCALVQWCHEHGVLYTNASVELWDPYDGAGAKHPTERTLYWRHMKLRQMVANWTEKGPTAVIEHGANPGLISHFTRQGLLDIARRMIEDGKVDGQAAEETIDLINSRSFNRLAARLNVRVIHCAERDTQVTNIPKRPNEFVNTWSVEGFREEGTTTAELGWGTHERTLPAFAHQHADGPCNQICISRMGMNTWVRSWVPHDTIVGMLIRHGEAFTISDKLTVWENGKAVYRPTVHYAYCPCDSAVASLHELRGQNYRLAPNHRILNDDIAEGSDLLGALLMGHPYNSWWTGSHLRIREARRLVPHQNATTVQVAIGIVSGILWMLENPQCGFCVPDDLPHDFILRVAKPYLGEFISTPSDWTPLKDSYRAFDRFNLPNIDTQDPWQFKNFLVTEND